ncbi:ribonuclease R [Skermanella rosea]|uniref:ribonuclease R n=1 Tax=Skermanella rosea TaxID=1817965 RepID=UPI001931A1BE|nr:ribonuclease R [Skermanella rosea]UEM05131.1 ribonuclease R [Skermanella rosea]
MTEDNPKKPAALPSRDEILAFIRNSPVPVGKREIAREFKLRGDDRIALKEMLRDLESEGAVERDRARRLAPPAALPAVGVLEVVEIDTDGEVLARPVAWTSDEPPPKIYMQPERRGHPALLPGDRVLAQLSRQKDRVYAGRTIRKLEKHGTARVLGIYEMTPDGARLRPTDKRQRAEFLVTPANSGDAENGELVVAEVLPSSRFGLKQAKVVERLGDMANPRSISLIAIHSQDLPTVFSEAALEEAGRAEPPTLEGRTDLRDIPLVTIDGADARDFDDAVWAEPDPEVPGGWHALVAIADVAFYVRPGRPLDRAAFQRGNSAYFPDRVVPMLPEALSNDLCSLRPGEERACLAVHLWIDARGELTRHRFVRGLMRSAARLTYEQVQAARDGAPDDDAGPLLGPVIEPLYGAFRTLNAARERRGTLELDLPERQVRLDERGGVVAITPRKRLDSHRLIEEFMICANVAAAEALEAKGAPCLYRVHDQPSMDKLESLREFLHGMGHKLAQGALKPSDFTGILERVRGRPEAAVISEVILRSQAQASYDPENIGHFGLALRRYAHFTSPIRRYADLMVHRALIRAYGLGPGGLDDAEAARMTEIAEHISSTERRAALAERDAVDRFTAAFLADRVGATFSGRITGVTRFGLFVELDETGADGLVPVSSLPDDQYEHQERSHALVGRRSGRVYRLGAPVKVKLVEADPVLGSTLFALLEDDGADLPWLRGSPGKPAGPGRPKDRPGGRGKRRDR